MEKIDPDTGTGGPELLVGSLFAERYRLIRMASAGANTVIFDADDTASGRPVTLKIVLPGDGGVARVPRSFRPCDALGGGDLARQHRRHLRLG